MSGNLPAVPNNTDLQEQVDDFSQHLSSYLHLLDLPQENVLVEISERKNVINNMPSIINKLNDEQRQGAFYVSKFIASSVVGLFDAALNYLWNETIINLRSKITRFDLNYFYDSIITDGTRRAKFKTEEDLKKLDDWELIKGCMETGIISEIGYKHLDYIRDMRNFASAAHPNQTQLTGLQLASWLETCILEVLAKEPSGPVLEVKRLLNSIRTEELDAGSTASTIANIRKLPFDLSHSLLRALFGMYTDEDLPQRVRDNINLISKAVWDCSSIPAKKDITLKYAIYSANLEKTKKELAKDFLSNVDGLSYLAEDQLAIEINETLENLLKAHYDYNNFYREEPYAKALHKLIPPTSIIPDMIRYNYVKALIICSLGNSYGVSYGGKPYYDLMISKFRDQEIIEFLKLFGDLEIISLIQKKFYLDKFIAISLKLEDQATEELLKKALERIDKYTSLDITSRNAFRDISKFLRL